MSLSVPTRESAVSTTHDQEAEVSNPRLLAIRALRTYYAAHPDPVPENDLWQMIAEQSDVADSAVLGAVDYLLRRGELNYVFGKGVRISASPHLRPPDAKDHE